jgi:hypothetical protein
VIIYVRCSWLFEWAALEHLQHVKVSPRTLESLPKITFIIHCHTVAYLNRVVKLSLKNPSSQVIVTSSNPRVAGDLESRPMAPSNLKLLTVPNRGRNFGGLWEAIPHISRESKYIVHLHSKEAKGNLLRWIWSRINWTHLGLGRTLKTKILPLLSSNQGERIGTGPVLAKYSHRVPLHTAFSST